MALSEAGDSRSVRRVGLLFVALALAPWPGGSWLVPDGTVATGSRVINSADFFHYGALIAKTAGGELAPGNPFTLEGRASGLSVRPVYLMAGLVMRLSGIDPGTAFQAVRIVWTLALLASMILLVSRVFPPGARALPLAVLALGSGLGWSTRIAPVASDPLDLWVPETHALSVALDSPHMTMALAAWCLLASLWLDPECGGRHRRILVFFTVLLLGLDQPYLYPPVAAVFAADALRVAWTGGMTRPGRRAELLVPACAAAAAATLYQGAIHTLDVGLAGWWEHAVTPIPSVRDFLVGYGLLLPLGLLGAWWGGTDGCRNEESPTGLPDRPARHARLFLTTWALVHLALLASPTRIQRKMVTGLHVPLALLAGGLLLRVRCPGPGPARIAAGSTLLLLLGGTNLVLLERDLAALRSADQPQVVPEALMEACRMLRRVASPGVPVLASWDASLYVAGLSGRQVMWGHRFQTVMSTRTGSQLKSLIEGSDPDRIGAWMRFLDERGIGHVLIVRHEVSELSAAFLRDGLDRRLPRIFAREGVEVFGTVALAAQQVLGVADEVMSGRGEVAGAPRGRT